MATYARSPTTQSGVGNTRTSITRTFTLWDGFIQVDYEVSSEADFDLFRIYVNGALEHTDSGTGVGQTSVQINTVSGSQSIRFEYEKDGSDNAGSDLAKVFEIRMYDTSGGPPDLSDQYIFTSGQAPPTGWTEVLNDGGTTVTGSHWETLTVGGGGVTGTIAATTTQPTFAATGKQTHVGTVAATTTAPTFAASGAQAHVGAIAATTTMPTFAGTGTVGAAGVSGVLAATTSMPTFAAVGVAFQPLPEGVEVFLADDGPFRVSVARKDFQTRVEVERGTSVQISKELSTVETSEG